MILTILLCLDTIAIATTCCGLLSNGNSNFADYCVIIGAFAAAFLTCLITTLVLTGVLHV